MKVSFVKGRSREKNIKRALAYFEDDLAKQLKDKKHIVVKPNCVSSKRQLASTHRNALKAVLEFIAEYNSNPITIAEGSSESTEDAFSNFNYFDLAAEFKLNFVDLNYDVSEKTIIYDKHFKPKKVDFAKTLLRSDFLLSLANIKTHNEVVATLSIKNILVGGLTKKPYFINRLNLKPMLGLFEKTFGIKNNKEKIHQGHFMINYNLLKLSNLIMPDFAVLDGYYGMEGNGPIKGNKVDLKVAIAGNPIAVDLTALKVMDIKLEDIGYLKFISEKNNINYKKIKIVGNKLIKHKFKLHKNIKEQLKWKEEMKFYWYGGILK